ncbi:MAG: tRNA (guanosine(37)-N1)-methyltransferase TrmD [Candidatus Paceibacterota bacterium]
MRFDILTIFPEAFESYFNTSIIKRAKAKKLLKINIFNLRKWTKNKHQTVDDRPYGGGAGMIFLLEPIFKALKDLKKKQKQVKTRVILFSLKGKKLTQKKLEQLKKYNQLILICPHYEGVDERVARYLADEEISIGDYILTGGELPAMILVDALTRLIPGAIREESLKEESFSLLSNKYEYPQYTRPEAFYPYSKNKKKAWRVPKILLSGNHQKIKEWRDKHLSSGN